MSSPTGFCTSSDSQDQGLLHSFPPRLALLASLSFSCTSIRSLEQQQSCRLSQPVFPGSCVRPQDCHCSYLHLEDVHQHARLSVLSDFSSAGVIVVDHVVNFYITLGRCFCLLASTGCLTWAHLCMLQTLFQSKVKIK